MIVISRFRTAGEDEAATAARDNKNANEDAAQAVDLAYQNLGIKSQKVLKDAATQARVYFETIKNSGTATAADPAAPFP